MMKQLTIEETKKIVVNATVLRAKYQYDEAIRLIEKNIDSFDPSLKLKGYLEMFYSAEEGNDHEFATRIAKKIAKEDPTLPSIQRYLR